MPNDAASALTGWHFLLHYRVTRGLTTFAQHHLQRDPPGCYTLPTRKMIQRAHLLHFGNCGVCLICQHNKPL
jgi:hypothetical protein